MSTDQEQEPPSNHEKQRSSEDNLLKLLNSASSRHDFKRVWNLAAAAEREHLANVYEQLFRLSTSVHHFVQAAEIIEILERYDYRTWPTHYILRPNNLLPSRQRSVSRFCERKAVDRMQRANYLSLALGGQQRHDDVAYGLSGKLLWRDKERVIEALLAMGKRSYTVAAPQGHEMENGVLHVAVSYKHTGRYDDNGTISLEQAHAIWTAVNSISGVEEHTVGKAWHEFGLLPYTCLPTVYVGNGDFGLHLARTRPWLWVELIAGLMTGGIHSRPGYDMLEDCEGVLSVTEHWPVFKTAVLNTGYLFGDGKGVDDGMREMTRIVSLWRREGFLGHSGYEYAAEFEEFVNWARWFVIRGKKYSEMAWNHDSSAVKGMDAVAFVRAIPTAANWHSLSAQLPAIPVVIWERRVISPNWTVEDIIDRTLIGPLPLDAIVESKEIKTEGGSSLLITGRSSPIAAMRLHKSGVTITLVLRND